MNRVKKSQRWIAVFFLTIFFPTLFPSNLYASNNGPNAPEAQGFEPVNATDMVNLASGDMSYVLPVMDVNGFPVTLSYHGGIPLDLESSWVGLGWNLNTGAINRNMNATPDDWNGGNSLDFIRYEKSEDQYTVNVGVGICKAAEVGVGMSWGSNKSVSGSVYGSVGIGKYAGVSGSIDTNGNYSLGVNAGTNNEGSSNFGGGIGISGNVNGGKVDVSIGGGVRTSNGLTMGIGTSLTGNGTSASLGFSNSEGRGKDTRGVSGSGSLSMSNFSQGDWDVSSKGWYIPIQIYFISLGFGKRKVTYSLEKSYSKKGYGVLYNNNASVHSDNNLPDNIYNDYQNRYVYGDAYDQALPQTEKEFVGDYDLEREKLNFTYAGYDNYDVNATGISGLMSPAVLDNATVFGMGFLGSNPSSTDNGKQRIYYHNGNVSRKDFGLNSSTKINFYFDGQFTSNQTMTSLSPVNSGVSTGNNLVNNLSAKPVLQNTRLQQGNFVEVFTNEQIRNGLAGDLLSPVNLPNSNRTLSNKFMPDGIGGYKVTAPDGKIYHFSLPVYHFEEVHRTIYKDNSEEHVSEKRQYTPYATHWLLTAITGPDFFDVNNNKIADEGDYGYWVRLDHGKWSDAYVWRNPTDKRLKDYTSNIESNIQEKDFGFYQFGRKQLYYLDKIVSNTHTAYFVKDLRYDSAGCDLNYNYTAQAIIENHGYNSTPSIVFEDGINYKRQLQLMLKKIVLVKNKDAIDFENSVNTGINPLSLNIAGISGYVDNYNLSFRPGGGFANEFGTNYNVKINQEQNVIDVKDFEQFDYSKAVKVVELGHNYNLAVKDHTYTPNSDKSNGSPGVVQNTTINPNHGKLTLKTIKFLGRNNYDYMPPYQFEYNGEFKGVSQAYIPYPKNSIKQKDNIFGTTQISIKDVRAKDEWGFLKNNPDAWTLTKIKTPTGAAIEFEHEQDDFYTEAFSRRFWTDDLKVTPVISGNSILLKFKYVSGYNGVIPDFRGYFSQGDSMFLDFWLCRSIDENCLFNDNHWDHWISTTADTPCVVDYVDSQNLTIKVPSDRTGGNSGDLWNNTFWIGGGNSNAYYQQPRGNCVSNSGGCGAARSDNHTMSYRLLASRVPKDETGGGLRIKAITLKDENNNSYKTSYYYNVPGTNKVKNVGNYKSSGITSYSPVKGTKFVPYQSELPSPGVMYEYVTMVAENSSGQNLGETRYRFYVLRPVLDIFNENIVMKYDDDEIMFRATVQNHNGSNGYFDSSSGKKVKAKSINLEVNTSLVGQFRSIEEFNNYGQLVSKVERKYLSGTQLKALAELPQGNANKIHRGTLKESFQSMKSVYTSDKDDNNPTLTNRLLTISSKEDYPSVLREVITTTPHGKDVEKYSNTDPMTGTFNTIEKVKSNGLLSKIERVPAYTKYPAMGSKAVNPNNKHMLTQEAMVISSVNYRTTDANITTWNDTWAYRNELSGNDEIDNVRKVWRKHKNFVWKESTSTNPNTYGAYLTNITKDNSQFDWSLGEPISNKWNKVSEITRYTRFSLPLETKDINGNFVSSKMADNNTKVLISGNSRYTEMYYSGAEFVKSGNLFDGEVLGAQYKTDAVAHTGENSVKANTLSDNVFQVTGSSGNDNYYTSSLPYTATFRPGKYKVSFWVYDGSNLGGIKENGLLFVNNDNIPVSEVVSAGCWQQMNYIFDIPPTTNNNTISVRAKEITGFDFFDDFRLHPVASSVSGFVYDQNTDQLSYMLDGNNLGSAFKHDDAGRVVAKYTEVVDADGVSGGFKIIGQYRQNYKNSNASIAQVPAKIENCYNNYLPMNVEILNECKGSFETRFKTSVSGGSGNYSFQYKWLTNFDNQTFTPYSLGSEVAFIPYVPKYCDTNTFDKLWKFRVKVTDVNTGNFIEEDYEYSTNDCLYSIDSRRWADLEISNCNDFCVPEDYVFRVHLKDIGTQGNFKYEYAYYEPYNPAQQNYFYDQNLNWIDVTSTNGKFCPEFSMMVDNNCPANYRKVVYYTFRITNLSTGLVSHYEPHIYFGRCMTCSDGICRTVFVDQEDMDYAEEGTLLTKDGDGKILSVNKIK